MKLGLGEMKRRAKIIETVKAENKSQWRAALWCPDLVLP